MHMARDRYPTDTLVEFCTDDFELDDPEAADSHPPSSAGRMSAEIKVVDVRRLQGPPERVFEIQTRHRRYFLDSNRRCIEVVDRDSGKVDPDHPTLGATVVGGQIRSRDRTEASYPLPVQGHATVFQRRDELGHTKVWVSSKVQHVTINVHHVRLH